MDQIKKYQQQIHQLASNGFRDIDVIWVDKNTDKQANQNLLKDLRDANFYVFCFQDFPSAKTHWDKLDKEILIISSGGLKAEALQYMMEEPGKIL